MKTVEEVASCKVEDDAIVANEGQALETVQELLHKTEKVAADGTRMKTGAAEDVQVEEGEGEEEENTGARGYNVGKCRHGCEAMSDVGLKSSFLSFSSDYHVANRHPPKNN